MKNRRRWVLAAAPPLEGRSCEEIRHGWLSDEIHVLRAGGRCVMTASRGRKKWETEIADWVFDAMWPATKGRRVRKQRYSWREQRKALALDVYDGKLEGLIVLESTALPDWAAGAIDVTGDPLFRDDALAKGGLKDAQRRLTRSFG